MKRITKSLISAAVVVMACGFLSLGSTNEVICGNIDALTRTDAGCPFDLNDSFEFDSYSTIDRWYRDSKEGFCVLYPTSDDPDGVCWEWPARP